MKPRGRVDIEGLPICPFRVARPLDGDETGKEEIVCLAAQGLRLAIKGGDPSFMQQLCGTCTIPKEAARRPCLFLVPMKVEREGVLKDHFFCRWFYRSEVGEPPEDTRWCLGCRYRFPLDHDELVYLQDYPQASQRIRVYAQEVWEKSSPPVRRASPQPKPPRSRWEQLRAWCFQMINRAIGAPY